MSMRMVKRIWRSGVVNDPMNETFKYIKRQQTYWLVWQIISSLGFFLAFGKRDFEIALIMLLATIISTSSYLHWSLAGVRRELWFVEYRLKLPTLQEELEDVELYKRWLKNYLEKERDGRGS